MYTTLDVAKSAAIVDSGYNFYPKAFSPEIEEEEPDEDDPTQVPDIQHGPSA